MDKPYRRRPTKSFTLSPETISRIEECAVSMGLNLSQALEILVAWGYEKYLEKMRDQKMEIGKTAWREDAEKRYWKRVFERDEGWTPL